jgi:hypothetical protein
MIDFPPRLRARTRPAADRPEVAGTVPRVADADPARADCAGFVERPDLVPAACPGPYAVGRAIDRGILAGDVAATIPVVRGAVRGDRIGTTMGILWHTFVVRTWHRRRGHVRRELDLDGEYAALSIGFDRIEDLDRVLPETMIRREPLPYAAGFLAGKAFMLYRRRGGAKSSPMPDFYIGAHAAVRSRRVGMVVPGGSS